jgi:hypothetical protein
MTDLEPIGRNELLREIRAFLPPPVREETQLAGSAVFVGGDPGEVIVRVHKSRVAVSIYAVEWEGPHTPVTRSKGIGKVNWKRLPAARLLLTLQNLIESAREIRRSRYRMCEQCGKTNPPEWMHDGKTCQACAERLLGVVH